MQKSDISSVQHSVCDLRGMSLELRMFIEIIACSSCPMSARSSQSKPADSGQTAFHGRSSYVTTRGKHSGESWARQPCSEKLHGIQAYSKPSHSPDIFPANAGPLSPACER